jgi:hypothetical protein
MWQFFLVQKCKVALGDVGVTAICGLWTQGIGWGFDGNSRSIWIGSG